jgi:DNA-binding PadR family transcriptional regulator
LLTNAEFAILSLIAERPSHGYELEQIIEARGMREWTEVGFSSIYYLLRKLESAGLASSLAALAEGKGPARKVYTITPAGKAALLAAIEDALSNPRRTYTPLQIGLANLPSLPPDQARAALQSYHSQLAARREHVAGRWQNGQAEMPPHARWMFELSLAQIDAELSFIHKLLDYIETKAKERME